MIFIYRGGPAGPGGLMTLDPMISVISQSCFFDVGVTVTQQTQQLQQQKRRMSRFIVGMKPKGGFNN